MNAHSDPRPASPNRIPLWVKLLFTVHMLVLVPYYWYAYGPTNFLYFCDVALFFTLAALWLESPLLASMPTVGILLPQTLWGIDFIGILLGHPVVGMTDYMFDTKIPTFVRGLSFFHFWLPWFLVWMVSRLGYDRRAFLYWTVLAWGLVLVCYLFLPAPPAPVDNPNLPVNVNYVYGFSLKESQSWMPQPAYVALLMVVLPTLVYAPVHCLLAGLWGRKPAVEAAKT